MDTNKKLFVFYKTQPIAFLLCRLALTVQYSIQSTRQAIQWSIILKLHPNYPETGRGWHPARDGSEDQVVVLWSLWLSRFLSLFCTQGYSRFYLPPTIGTQNPLVLPLTFVNDWLF